MKYRIISTLALISLISPSYAADSTPPAPTSAPDSSSFATTVDFGSLGIGLNFSTPMTPDTFNLRLNGNYYSFSRSESLSTVNYTGTLKLNSIGLVADWFPFKNGFRLSAGAYYNGNKATASGTPAAGNAYTINDVVYTSAQVGTINGNIKLGNSFAPYLGLGWGNPVGSSGQWSFFSDLGVLFIGSPKVTLSTTGGALSSDATFQANLLAEQSKAQKDISVTSVYPVIAFGFSYKF